MSSASFSGTLSSFRYASSLDRKEVRKLGLSEEDTNLFLQLVQTTAEVKEALPTFDWASLRPVDAESLPQYEQLPQVSDEDKVDILSRFAIVKLNGGVGSTMGLRKPKALITVKDNQTFLSASLSAVSSLNGTFSDLSVPLVFMNSFATHDPTVAALAQLETSTSVPVLHFQQRKFPRLRPTTLRTVPTSSTSGDECWYPPGHGDVFEMIVRSGTADALIEMGKEWAFVSNIDNLAAELDARIAKHVISKGLAVMLEYTPRTSVDRTGGVLVRGPDGNYQCLELSQVPEAEEERFSSLDYGAFHTNNMWMHLPSIKKLVAERTLHLKPSVISREQDGEDVVQLESPVSAIHHVLPSTGVLAVPRRRWRVIKTTADLLMVRSPGLLNLHRGRLVISSQRRIPGLPSIKWGSSFRSLKDLELRCPFPPDLRELVHLSVEGDVRLGKNVVLKGTVILIASPGETLRIPDGAVLRDNIVIGSLMLTQH